MEKISVSEFKELIKGVLLAKTDADENERSWAYVANQVRSRDRALAEKMDKVQSAVDEVIHHIQDRNCG